MVQIMTEVNGNMGDKMQIKRGLVEDMPILDSGELGFTYNTNELYVGTPEKNNKTITIDGGELPNLLKGSILFKRGKVADLDGILAGEPVLLMDTKELLIGLGHGDYLIFKDYETFQEVIDTIEEKLDLKMNQFDKISASQLNFDTDEDKIGLVHLKKEVIDALTGSASEISFDVADYSITNKKLGYQCIDAKHLRDGIITKRKIMDREICFEKLSRDLQKKVYEIEDHQKEISVLKQELYHLKKVLETLGVNFSNQDFIEADKK